MVTVLDFWAEWCRPCKAMAPIIDAVENTGLVLIDKINVEEYEMIAAAYEVTNIPTYILVDDDGNELRRKSGAMSRKAFTEFCGIDV